MLPRRVRKGQRIQAEDMNRVRGMLKGLRSIDSGGGLYSAASPGGLNIQLAARRKQSIWCQVVALGPDGESDYSDERYWVRSAVPVNTSGDANDTLELGKQDILDIDGVEYVAGSGKMIAYGAWVTATNLSEWLDQSHGLAVNTPVLIYPIFDSRTEKSIHWVFISSSGGAGASPIRPGEVDAATEESGLGSDMHTYTGTYKDPTGGVWKTAEYVDGVVEWTAASLSTLQGRPGVRLEVLTVGDAVEVVHFWEDLNSAGEEPVYVWQPQGIQGIEAVEYVICTD